MPKRSGPLTARERAFVSAFVGPCAGNATKAAIKSGYSKKTARQAAARLLSKVNIKAAIEAIQEKREVKAILTADERDLFLSRVVLNARVDMGHRIRSVDLLNKAGGRYSSTLIHKGRLTLEEALTAARDEE